MVFMDAAFVHHRPALVGSPSGGLSLPHYVNLDIFDGRDKANLVDEKSWMKSKN